MMPKKLSTSMEVEIAAKYAAGASSFSLAWEYGCCDETIRKALRCRRVPLRKARRLSPAEKDAIAADYLTGDSCKSVGRKHGVTSTSILRVLRELQVPTRTIGETRRLAVNDGAFDLVTPESAYWIGFLMADGYISHNNSIQLCLAEKDRAHVLAFQAFLGSEHPVTQKMVTIKSTGRTHAAARISLISKRLTNALAQYGVVPNKSLTAKVIGLENNADFWRGVVDGDGSIAITNSRGKFEPTLELVGSHGIVSQFAAFVKSVSPESTSSVRPQGTIWVTNTHGKCAVPVIDAMYMHCTTALKRKRRIALQILLASCSYVWHH